MTNTRLVELNSRPERIAFLVDPKNQDAPLIIKKIIDFCTQSWGGGYHPILPIDKNEIEDHWWNLLVAYDPDTIVTTIELEKDFIEKIYREIAPYRFLSKTKSFFSYISPIDSLYIPKFLQETDSPHKKLTYTLLKSSRTAPPLEDYVRLNFGLYHETVKTDLLLELPNVNRQIINDIDDPSFFFNTSFQSNSSNVLFPSDIARLYSSPPFNIRYSKFARAFHLIIGESANDLLQAWNRSLISSEYFGRDMFWMTESMIDNDSSFIKNFCKWVSCVYWNKENSIKHGYIISSSIDSTKLQEIADDLKNHSTNFSWSICQDFENAHKKIEYEEKRNSDYPLLGRKNINLRTRTQIQFATKRNEFNKTAFLQPIIPPFLSNQNCIGSFMVDVYLEYIHPKICSSPTFCLPKRYASSKSLFPKNDSRPTKYGIPSVRTSVKNPSIIISEPKMEPVLDSFRYQVPNTLDSIKKNQIPKYSFEVSDEGKTLIKILEIFGDFNLAAEFFSDPFWFEIALRCCNLRSIEHYEKKKIQTLSKAIFQTASSLEEFKNISENDCLKLATNLNGKLNNRETKEEYLSEDSIKTFFKKFRGNKIKKGNESTNWKDCNFGDHYKPYLQKFLDRGVFRKGARITCPSCEHKSWFLLDDLTHIVSCRACSANVDIPLDLELTFKLNDILIKVIQKNSLPYVIRALHYLQMYSLGMFAPLPCHDVFLKGDKDRLTDLDIVAFNDSGLIIGEAKSDPSKLTEEGLSKLEKIALEIFPSEVIIATQKGEYFPGIKHKLEEMQSLLEKNGIRFRKISLEKFVNWDSSNAKSNRKKITEEVIV